MAPQHIPVMVEEVMTLLKCEPSAELTPKPHRTYVDATLGGGGHALEILKRTSPDGILIGMDWDEDAIAEAARVLLPFQNRASIFRENFIHLPGLLKRMGVERVHGILLDLGLSSIQVEKEERGFSLKSQGPLDMRMDQRMERSAADLVNRLSPRELEKTLVEFGEERWAKRIAKAIVRERERTPILTTQGLRRIVYHAIPRRFHVWRIDPATRTFQALRIRLNEELENLKQFLEKGWACLEKGGRICVISFHSLEDRIVKETFRRLEKGGVNEVPHAGVLQVITRKPITPSPEEVGRNPRSRSAKLRCAERREE